MPCMYFSGVDSSAITTDDPIKRRIIINPVLYDRVRNNEEENARFFLDTHLLRIRKRSESKSSSERLVPKSKESVDIGISLLYLSSCIPAVH